MGFADSLGRAYRRGFLCVSGDFMSVHKYIAPAVLLSFGAVHSAQAQSSVTLYGMVDLSLASIQYSGTSGSADNTRTTKVDGNQMVTSFIGFKGIEDLGEGLKVGFAVESFLRPDTGASGRNDLTINSSSVTVKRPDVFWGRAANVWVQGSLGKVTLGRQGNLLFSQVVGYNPFGGAFGLSPAVRLTFGKWGNDRGDSGWSNAISYNSPTLAGFTATVQAQAAEVSDGSEKASYGVGVNYVAGPFAVAGAWQTVRSAADPMLDLAIGQSQTFGLISGSYDAGFAKFFGQYGAFDNKGYTGGLAIDTRLFQLGASVPVTTNGKVLASYGESKEKPVAGGASTKHSILTLAYDHWLSKRTDTYVAVMVDDEKATGFKQGTSLVFGVRHAF
jgi:predicted porin